jgi:hypothetical protein
MNPQTPLSGRHPRQIQYRWAVGEVSAVRGSFSSDPRHEAVGRLECRWQRDQLPQAIRELVIDDQRLRNDICWSVFDC